jgi:hypothetical protein
MLDEFFKKDNFLYDIKQEYEKQEMKNNPYERMLDWWFKRETYKNKYDCERMEYTTLKYKEIFPYLYSANDPRESLPRIAATFQNANMNDCADILTSSYSQVKAYLSKFYNLKMEYNLLELGDMKEQKIKELSDKINQVQQDKSLIAFLKVNHTIGNCIPAIANWSPGRAVFGDTTIYKVNEWEKVFKNYKETLYDEWKIRKQKIKEQTIDKISNKNESIAISYLAYNTLPDKEDVWLNMIKNLFLEDYFDMSGKIKDNIEICYNSVRAKEADQNSWKNWFEMNAKLIVQRGYRMKNSIHEYHLDKHELELIFDELELSARII